jgi:hypothetical protein
LAILDFDGSYEKQPSEQKTIRADFSQVCSNLVVSGYVLTTAEVKVFDSTGTDLSATMIQGAPTVDAVNNWVFVTLKNGADLTNYTARFKTTWTKAGQPDQTDEKDLLIQVRQRGFA